MKKKDFPGIEALEIPDLQIETTDFQIEELDLPELEPIVDYSLQIGEIAEASLLDEMIE